MEHTPGIPTPERLERGPVACIECVQCIPCNPCETACPQKAITVGAEITALPKLDADKCNGCGICITRCPGLAIFNLHKNYSETTSLVSFPYEYVPLPEPGRPSAAPAGTARSSPRAPSTACGTYRRSTTPPWSPLRSPRSISWMCAASTERGGSDGTQRGRHLRLPL